MPSDPLADQPQAVMPPPLQGQVMIAAANVVVGDIQVGPVKQQALMITPAGTQLTFIVPMGADAAKEIGAALLAKNVVLPNMGQMGGML
jgi:hypothetical protein